MPPFITDIGDVKEQTKRSRLWQVRDTLLRRKITKKVLYKYEEGQFPSLGTIIEEDHPPPNPFSCEDECKACFPQFFPATVAINDSTAQETMPSLRESIEENITYLRDALTAHADYIVTRWRKKSRDKRFAFLREHSALYPKKWAAIHLLNAVNCPNSEIEHVYYAGPEVQPFLVNLVTHQVVHVPRVPYGRDPQGVSKKFRDTWLLPYLDAEILSEDPMLLLALLHNRTFYKPGEWVSFDSSNVALAECFGSIDHVFNAQCVVVQGPDYGRLVNWNAQQMHRGEIMGFTKAYFVLTAQSKMMAFLRRFVSGLQAEAQDLPTFQVNSRWSQMVASSFSIFAVTSAWSSDSIKPFSPPPSFDSRRIIDTIASRHRAIKDEIELLQTDPPHVRLRTRELASAHFFEDFPGSDKWPFFVDQILLLPLQREMYWRQLVVESERLAKSLTAYEMSPSDTESQAEYDHLVEILECLCIETFAIFESSIPSSLLFQRGFERNHNIRGDGKNHKESRRFNTADFFPHDMLYWAVSSLGQDEYRPLAMDPSLNFMIIDYLCRKDEKEAARISPNLLAQISDMAVIYDFISSIRSRKGSGHLMTEKLSKQKSREEHREQFLKKLNAPFEDQDIGDELGEPFRLACTRHPWPRGKKDLTWLSEADAAYDALDKFWSEFRAVWTSTLRDKGGCSQAYVREDIDGLMSMSQDEKHLAERNELRKYIQHQDILRRQKQKNTSGNKVAQTTWGDDSSSSPSATTVKKSKAKRLPLAVKTNEMAPKAVETGTILPSKPNLESTLEPVKIKHDNMSVFMAMFPKSGEESSRSFAWQHFLAAMTDAGFSILQSQGSAVTLKLEQSRGVDTIVVHRPHPVATIHPIMLRSIAKRITKWFGWRRETFMEREKEDDTKTREVVD